ncbi:MAG: DNA recombination protein RmuC [Bacteroidales bacterium]
MSMDNLGLLFCVLVIFILSGGLLFLIKQNLDIRKLYISPDESERIKNTFELLIREKETFIQRIEADLKDQIQKQEDFRDTIMHQSNRLTELTQQKKSLEDQLTLQKEDFLRMKEVMQNEFKLLAQEIFEEKSKRITEVNKENIQQILNPLSEKLVDFKRKVEETYDRESKERFSLQSSIKELVELNNRISNEANNLTKALRGDSKIQGDWGEMILETILEKSGLRKGEGYFTQEYLKDEMERNMVNDSGRRMRPDVIVAYPDKRKVIIDSKVSLTAYVRYQESDSDEDQKRAVSEHLLSVKRHIDELSAKKYDDYEQSLDFVMMFIPNDAAYMTAMKEDSTLWNYAYERRIVLISPTNLITALKLISDLWKREYQNRNAMDIADRGGKLYDKFVVFVEHMKRMGDYVDKSQKSYNDAMRSLSEGNGNLINQARQLKDLGVKAKKSLPEGE